MFYTCIHITHVFSPQLMDALFTLLFILLFTVCLHVRSEEEMCFSACLNVVDMWSSSGHAIKLC